MVAQQSTIGKARLRITTTNEANNNNTICTSGGIAYSYENAAVGLYQCK